jgi:ferredoxin
MPVLHLALKDGERRLPFAPGLSVREILATADIQVRSACGGVGPCGPCRGRIEAGGGGDPTANELINLAPEQMQRGIRLACQIRLLQDMRIAIEPPAPTTNWRSMDAGEYRLVVVLTPPVPALRQEEISPGGAADLGTAQIPPTVLMHTRRSEAMLRGQPEWLRDAKPRS